ncbi:hypothetical protein [Fastidiosibacter lacustris]|uniref:hypothetical protein n=1 Tax=Fastidiosibacter lacustris TaxID=2056695 RepID=UPI000E3457A7|nr:hypothetical protein [Fastidiosibacter lacustris]
MNDNQKERLLKIAETNPELAKEMMDFMKEERQSSQEPVAVKVVKAEEDKLTFTEEQKKWAFGYIAFILLAMLTVVLAIILANIFLTDVRTAVQTAYAFAPIFFIFLISCIIASYYCAYKAGMPAIKQFMSKHFKLQS